MPSEIDGLDGNVNKTTDAFGRLGAAAKKSLGEMSGYRELKGVFDNLTSSILKTINPIKMLSSEWGSLVKRVDSSINLGMQFGKEFSKITDNAMSAAIEMGIAYDDMIKGQETLLGVTSMSVSQTQAYTKEMARLSRGTNVGVETFAKLAGEAEGFNTAFSSKNLRQITDSFSAVQDEVGFTNTQMEEMLNFTTDSVKKLSAFGDNTKAINNVAKATANVSAMYKKVGLSVTDAIKQVDRFLNPEDLDKNAYLLSQMGVSFGEYVDMLEGGDAEAVMSKMSAGLYDAAQQAKDMSFFQKKAFADTLGVSAQELTRLGNMTRDEFEATQVAGEESAMTAEEKQIMALEKMEVTLNRMNESIMGIGQTMMETLQKPLKAFVDFMTDKVYAKILDFWKWVRDGDKSFEYIKGVVIDFFKEFQTEIIKTVAILGGLFLFVKYALPGLLKMISKGISFLTKGLFGAIGKGISSLMGGIAMGVAKLGVAFVTAAPGILVFSLALLAIGTIVRFIVVPAVNLLLDGLSRFLERVLPFVIAGLAILGNTITSVVDSVMPYISSIIESFLEFYGLIVNVVNTVVEQLPNIVNAFSNLWSSISGILTTLSNTFLGVLGTVERMTATFVNFAEVVGNVVIKVFGTFGNVFSDVRGSLEAIPEIIKSISSASPNSLTSLVRMAKNMYELASGIESVADASGEMGDAWSNLGKASVRNGKIEMVSAPSDEMKNMFTKGGDSIKGKLEEVVKLLTDIKGARGSRGLYKMVDDTASIKNIQGLMAVQADKKTLEEAVGFAE